MECLEFLSPTGLRLSANLVMYRGALWKFPFMNFQPSYENAGTTIRMRPLKRAVQTASVGDPPTLASSSSYANTHGCSDTVSSPKPYFLGFGKWLMMFGGTQTPVSRVKVRCDPPLNLDLHPSWHVLASGSILQHIVCSSHLKGRRWLEVAGTSSPYPKGHTSRVWMGDPWQKDMRAAVEGRLLLLR